MQLVLSLCRGPLWNSFFGLLGHPSACQFNFGLGRFELWFSSLGSWWSLYGCGGRSVCGAGRDGDVFVVVDVSVVVLEEVVDCREAAAQIVHELGYALRVAVLHVAD